MAYNSDYTGEQIDNILKTVADNQESWSGKQPKLSGTQGQVVGFDALGNAIPQDFSGAQGPPGEDGKDGKDGKDGAPGAPGVDGITPHIGENGNWFIGETDTDTPATGPQGAPGVDGGQGPAGPGVPTGGEAGQILAKNTNADYDTHWIDPPESGSAVESFNGRTGAVTPQAGDYTAADVGAATMAQVTAAIQAAVLDSWEGTY